jgi:hypothetical protein
MNLKHETIKGILMSGHTPDQIIFIGSEKTGHRCTWGEFLVLADREYDGLEWWWYSTPFVMPQESHPITSLIVDGGGWRELSYLNK